MTGKNLSTGLTGRAVRIDEVQPRLRDRDVVDPLFLDRAQRIAFRRIAAIARLPDTASAAQTRDKVNEILDMLVDAKVMDP